MADAQSLVLNCQFCSFVSSTKKTLLKHIKESHANDHGFLIKCLLCDRSFRIFSSFTSHVSRSHPGVTTESAYQYNVATEHQEGSNAEIEENQNHRFDEADHDYPSDCPNHDDTPSFPAVYDDAVARLSMSAGRFIVGLKEKHLVNNIMYILIYYL